MKIIDGDLPIYCGVDDTLVKWKNSYDTYGEVECVEILGEQRQINRRQIDQLIQHKQRGHTIIVWSASGVKWATEVVKALGLDKYIDAVITKPTRYYDAKDASEFMKNRTCFSWDPLKE